MWCYKKTIFHKLEELCIVTRRWFFFQGLYVSVLIRDFKMRNVFWPKYRTNTTVHNPGLVLVFLLEIIT